MKALLFIVMTILTVSAKVSAESITAQATADLRQEIDRKTTFNQLNGIGVISTDSKDDDFNNYIGTGFLVSPCHVLTNVHVAFDENEQLRNGKNVYFSAGQTDSTSRPFKAKFTGSVVAHGKHTEFLDETNSDWVVIKLSKSVNSELDYIPMYQMDADKMMNRQVVTAGFPGDRAQEDGNLSKMYGDVNCKIFGVSVFGHINHNCQTTNGQSGSPILAMAPNGKYYAIGMLNGKHKNSTGLERTEEPDLANSAVSFQKGNIDIGKTEGDKIFEAIKNNKCD